jgi:hypothetical protein
MTKQEITHSLESIFARIRSWPPEMQEDVIDFLEAIMKDFENPVEIPPEHLSELEAAMNETDFATDEEIVAVFGRSFR